MDRVISRRKLLSTAALGCAGLGLGIAAAPKARAFTLEEPSQPVAAQYLAARAACSRGGMIPFTPRLLPMCRRSSPESTCLRTSSNG